MLLTLHIMVAVISIISSLFLVISPSKARLKFNYGIILLTLVSGTTLVLIKHLAIVSACESGILYLSVVFSATFLAQKKLARTS
ncbi:MAG: hypothetical protein ACHQT9_03075 [Candidatus Saccharimonadales bacterium]